MPGTARSVGTRAEPEESIGIAEEEAEDEIEDEEDEAEAATVSALLIMLFRVVTFFSNSRRRLSRAVMKG